MSAATAHVPGRMQAARPAHRVPPLPAKPTQSRARAAALAASATGFSQQRRQDSEGQEEFQQPLQPAEPAATPDLSAQQEAELAASDEAGARDFALALAKAAWDTKAGDPLVLHVAPLVYWTRYMVLLSVYSRPQLGAVLARLTAEAEGAWGRRLPDEAVGSSNWELLDFGDVVVHVMTPEQRDYYDLEGFYAAAEEVDLPFAGEEPGPPPGASPAASWRPSA